MTDMINMLLKCTGCDLLIEPSDIEDVDNVPNKLGDLQDEYQAANITDYPLISKAKQYSAFRAVLADFFGALIKTMHATSVLHEDHALFENIQLWVDTMSSAGIRPFRHTATVISLTISTALCEVARDLQNHIARTRSQLEAEKKKRSVNKGRVSTLTETIAKAEGRLEHVESLIKDEFDAVFVHRYRDVDPKIRVECVAALGSWILTYRKMFLEGQYLRYLGWVLSDTVPQTRLEVVNQLRKMFKDPQKLSALRSFTERFRPRLVEMAIRDAEPGVRASTIELLELLRVSELLEPDDVDSVGQLIFDSEPRVRKAVAKFFVANIDDLFQAQIDEVGEEQLGEHLPEETEDYLKPIQSWIKFKCLAQTLKSYAREDDEETPEETSHDILLGSSLDSRYVLATQAIFNHMPELADWETLAGYVLYDHSQLDEDSPVDALYKLNEGEETVLLEVLDNAVKLHLLQLTETVPERKGGRRKQADKDELLEKQERSAHDLTKLIPQLLNKYGSVPKAASAILRLEHLLNMDLLSDLQQSTTTYTALLDDINKQFMSHSDRSVLAEASIALLNAKKYEQSKEATDNKVQEMYGNTVEDLQKLLNKQNIEARGTLPIKTLKEISNTLSRLSNLASISDCTNILETRPSARKQKGAAPNPSPLNLLLGLAKRGVPDDDTTESFVQLEDEVTLSVSRIILFYFMWKVQILKLSFESGDVSAITDAYFDSLVTCRDDYLEVIFDVTSPRPLTDPIRIQALSTVLDLFTLISTLRNVSPSKGSKVPDSITSKARSLVIETPSQVQSLVAKTHEGLEKHFARLSRRTLDSAIAADRAESAALDDPTAPPVDPDEDDPPESSDEEDNADPSQQYTSKAARQQATLVAEQSLCEFTGKIVLAVIARVFDASPQSPLRGNYKQRLLRNRTRLGQNYREVLAYLEDPKDKSKKTKPLVKVNGVVETANKAIETTSKGSGSKKQPKSDALVIEDDDIEDDEAPEEFGEEDLRRRGLEEDEEEVEAEGDSENRGEDVQDDDIMGD